MTRTTGYVWHERYGWHDTGSFAGIVPPGPTVQPFHNFESPESKTRFNSLVEVSGLIDHLTKLRPRLATEEDVLRVHTPRHVEHIRTQSEQLIGDAGDGWSPFGRGAYEIALLAAGGTITATEAVLTGAVDNAYALVRPPGHHAERDLGMGYCLFANIPVAIEWARAHHGVERIAVVDYDVHHGNGTQHIYEDDPDVLAISLHQDRLFPQDSGMVDETGTGEAQGTTINVPLPAGSGNGAYLASLERVVAPALRAFRPQLIMVASGFDASAVDPLGGMTVTSSAYRSIATTLVGLAEELSDGRIVFSHEGGYSPVYVPYCGLAVLEAMSGVETGVPDPYAHSFEHSPAHPLKPWQDEVIGASELIARRLGLVV
jgi:acetoin utilization deacetylase AcuC-like enzyme